MPQKQIAEKAKTADLDFTDYPDELLTENQASEVLGLAPHTLANWRGAGKGPRFVRIGTRTIRYPKSALEEFAQHELTVREPTDDLSDAELVKQIARLANRLARRQRQPQAT